VVTTGIMVRTKGGGYRIADKELAIRPPLDLHWPIGPCGADSTCLDAVYSVVLASLDAPRTTPAADRLSAAIGWLIKTWRNTATVHFGERIVFLKTAFEALTGTSDSWQSAKQLRALFEAVPDTSDSDSEQLIWSPAEKPVHTVQRRVKGVQTPVHITDLQHWFLQFAYARNLIIHDGIVPSLNYASPTPPSTYDGHMVFTAEFLLRAVIKVSLAPLGYPDLWRSAVWRAVKTATEEWEANAAASQDNQV
jgi:hypothetical protein